MFIFPKKVNQIAHETSAANLKVTFLKKKLTNSGVRILKITNYLLSVLESVDIKHWIS